MEKYNFDKSVLDWNKEKGFLDKGFNVVNEGSYLLSEIFELIEYKDLQDVIVEGLIIKGYEPDVIEEFANAENHDKLALAILKRFLKHGMKAVDFVDVATDLDVFSVGARGKLGLSEDEIMQCRKIVMDANWTKVTGEVTEDGKQKKPEGFIPPEEKMSEYLGGKAEVLIS